MTRSKNITCRDWTRQVPLVLGLWLAATPALTQGDVVFSDTTEVRAVHLDVLVLDQDGQPVRNLRREDFVVREDGVPVEIDFFDLPNVPTPPHLPGAPLPPDSLPPTKAVSAERAAGQGPVEWIVFVDDLRLDGGARKRVLRDLESLFSVWHEAARLRLVIQREDQVLESGPFDDPADLVAALKARPKGLVRGVMSSIARSQTMNQLAGVREACALSGRDLCNDCWGEQLAVATRYAVDEVERVEVTALHLKNMLTRLDPSQGRRSLLYVGDGLPLFAGGAVFWSLAEVCSERRFEVEGEVLRYRQQRTLEEIGALANAQRTALLLLDAGGLRNSENSNDSEHYRNLQAGLQTLAEQTGGKAILNANRALEPVRAAVREEATRYELGFTLSRPPTGRVHRVDIELRGEAARGRTLRYRRTFWDRTSDMRLLQQLAAASSMPGESTAVGSAVKADETDAANRLVALRLAPVEPGAAEDQANSSRRERRVTLQIAISQQLVTVVPTGAGEERGRITLALLVSDTSGQSGDPKVRQIELGAGGLQAQGGWYFVEVGVETERGERAFSAAVRDEVTGQITTARHVARVP